MDYSLITRRLGEQIRQRRLNRGLTQAKLAALAGITRQKVIAIEKGDLTVGMTAYARVLGALDCEFALVSAAMPTLDEIQECLTDDSRAAGGNARRRERENPQLCRGLPVPLPRRGQGAGSDQFADACAPG